MSGKPNSVSKSNLGPSGAPSEPTGCGELPPGWQWDPDRVAPARQAKGAVRVTLGASGPPLLCDGPPIPGPSACSFIGWWFPAASSEKRFASGYAGLDGVARKDASPGLPLAIAIQRARADVVVKAWRLDRISRRAIAEQEALAAKRRAREDGEP